MEFLEKDLEEIIFNADKYELAERGLWLQSGKLFRQLRIGKYGVADLVHAYFEYDQIDANNYIRPKLYVNVIELKKDKIGISAFLQAVSYLRGIQRYLNRKHHMFDIELEITLIGKSIDESGSFSYLPALLNNVSFYTYSYDFDGIRFEYHSGYKLIDEGF